MNTGRFLWVVICLLTCGAAASARAADRLPNVVVIFTDDQGYQDVGCFGSPNIRTPNLDRMAKEGMRFTDFHVAAAVCSSSRAALLTGCYPQRVSIMGALGPNSPVGINPDELTLAELCKQKGYATAIFGKWHLGDHPKFLPTRHGFDEYYGIPYSNDMWPFHPFARPGTYPPLPLIEGEKVIAFNPDQTRFTTAFTEHAVDFITRNKERPFFLYVPHPMPHVPLFVSDKFKGKSERGLYGDVIMEIDWSVGQILAALKESGVDEHTLVIFTSDNGPWLSYDTHGGSALPLREGKGTTFEGGQREACIMRWPGTIPAGRECHELATTMDILPTVAKLLGVELDPQRPIDGKNILPLMTGEAGAKSPHEVFYYYWLRHLQAVRSGPWKLHLPHPYRSRQLPAAKDLKRGQYHQARIELSLYNLDEDISEQRNVADQHPEMVAKLKRFAEQARREFGDSATKTNGAGVRPPGRL